MQLYGFPPSVLFGLVNRSVIIPFVDGKEDYNFNSAQCTFDVGQADLGCSAIRTPCNVDYVGTGFPDWLATTNSATDLRPFYST